jgi:hypothetical protein
MFPKRMLHVPALRRSLRLPDARSRHWNETFSQVVAVARRLAVVLYRMRVDGSEFQWSKDSTTVRAIV